MATGPALLSSPERAAREASIELLVTWQDPVTRRYHPVGVLARTLEGTYRFRYLEGARRVTSFLPFLGFSALDRDYTSPHLFPLFAERVLDESRPDRVTLFEALDLVDTAGPMEFLARSGGRRAGDTIEMVPVPTVDGVDTTCVFLVHGVRYLEGASEALESLTPGQALRLEPEPENEHDPLAVLVSTDEARLGWVPNPLLDYVRAVMGAGAATLTVVRANPPELGHHMRLLVRIEGRLPAGYQLPWRATRD